MDIRLEQVLDACIRRIATEGATVEECLARYPQYAAEMEPHLRVAARMASALSRTPTANAKERARLRLHAELRSLQSRDQANAARRWRWRLPVLAGAWRAAAASAVVVVAFIFAGTGLVAASGDSVPGNTLYPVKRTAEDVRLAVTFSAEAKAQLHLAYAERRGDELATLVEAGAAERIPTAQAALDSKLAAISNTLAALPEDTAAQLRDRLQDSSTAQLARLQEAIRDAPTSSKDAASASFQQASASYGNAVEAALVKAPVTYVPAQQGAIQLRVTDPPPPGVEKVMLTVEQVEAHVVAGGEGRWVLLFVAPQSFDLLQVADVHKVLGQAQVTAGTYTRLRFLVSSATVVVNGVEHAAKVPSDRISFTRPFTVEEGKTTVVLLDFDGAKSLKTLGQGQFVMTPVVHVLARRSFEVRAVELREDGEKERVAATGQEKQAPRPTPSGKEPTAERRPPAQVEIEGPVQSLSQGELVVRGQPVEIPEGKVQAEAVKENKRVVIVAQERPDGSLVATEVKESPSDKKRPEKDAAVGDKELKPEPAEVQGVLRAIEGDVWLVGERRLHIGPDTVIRGDPILGARVAAKGLTRDDGGVDAQAVQIEPAPAQATPTPPSKDKPPAATPTPLKDQSGQDPGSRATPTSEKKVPATTKPGAAETPKVTRPTPTPVSVESKGAPTKVTPSRPKEKLPTATPSERKDNSGRDNR